MGKMHEIGAAAKAASRRLSTLTTEQKNVALLGIADKLEARKDDVLKQNRLDVQAGREKGLGKALLDRLLLNETRVAGLASDTRHVATLPDPVGTDIESRVLPNGIHLSKRRIPIGVLGVIYEARPNVTIDIAALSLKTGNAVILRGGTETLRSNLILVEIIRAALRETDVPEAAVQYLDNPDRSLVTQLLRLDQYVDMIIPRGGATLHRLCKEQSTIPVITGGIGVCHLYVDESAEMQQAVDIVENSKVQRPSVCNALDTLLIHQSVAPSFLPAIAERLLQHDVELRVDETALAILQHEGYRGKLTPAGAEDFDREWLALILGVRVVDGLDEAITHIQQHSSEHTESILTNNLTHASRFVREINSAAVFVNASTRFNDGGQFGLGAEVAVSTQKLHARGPLGLEELTTYKWIGIGDGHIRK